MKILAVDISALFSQFWEVDNGRGRDFDAPRQSTINAVRRWREGHDRVAICCDSGKSFRSQIWTSYKANRPDRGEEYRNQIRLTIDALASDGCSVFRAPQYKGELYAEADDVIGSLCAWAYESGHAVTILSSDKDLMQLVTDTVSLVRPALRPLDKDYTTFRPAEVKAKLGIEPHLVPHWLALAGDASDNYKPYQGIGDKRAIELLSAAGHALAVFEGAVSMTELTRILGSKLAESLLAAGAEPARKALEVATVVRDIPLDFETLAGEPVFSKVMPMDAPQIEPTPESQPQPAQQAPQVALVPTIQTRQQIDRSSPWALQPTGQKGLVDFAGYVVDSRLFPNIKDHAAAIVVIAWGQNLGIPAMIALSQAYVVHGRVGWGAQLIAGIVKNNPSCIKFHIAETDDKHATVIYQRKGEPEGKYVFTLDRAQKMGVIKADGPWEKIPATMCRWAAMRECARMVWPDVVTGVYTPDELTEGDIPEHMIARMVAEGGHS
jgi:5'-3' exonuclease